LVDLNRMGKRHDITKREKLEYLRAEE
jgi:hypothetical protein